MLDVPSAGHGSRARADAARASRVSVTRDAHAWTAGHDTRDGRTGTAHPTPVPTQLGSHRTAHSESQGGGGWNWISG